MSRLMDYDLPMILNGAKSRMKIDYPDEYKFIKKSLRKLDNPLNEYEFICHKLLEHGITFIVVESDDKPSIEDLEARDDIPKQLKNQIIDFRYEFCKKQDIYINRKSLGDVSRIAAPTVRAWNVDTTLVDLIPDCAQIKKNNKPFKCDRNLIAVGDKKSVSNCDRNLIAVEMVQYKQDNLVRYQKLGNQIRPDEAYLTFQSVLTILPNYSKYELCKEMAGYYKAAFVFTRTALQVSIENMAMCTLTRITAQLDQVILDNKVTHKKLDDLKSGAKSIAGNSKNPRVTILCRKNDWKARRYLLVGALRKDPRVKALIKDQDSYSIFKIFESNNNPSMIKTNLVEEFKDSNRLTRDVIEIDGKNKSVIRLTDKNFDLFVKRLRNHNDKYEALVEDSEDSDDDYDMRTCLEE